jgi:hypothetical protein
MFQAVLDEVVDLCSPETGEARDLVDDHDIVLAVCDVVTQLVVDVSFTAASRTRNWSCCKAV